MTWERTHPDDFYVLCLSNGGGGAWCPQNSNLNLSIAQAVGTLPLGPAETGPTWYARARLAYRIFAAYIFGEGQPQAGRWVILVTRVMELTPELTLELLRRVIAIVKELCPGLRVDKYNWWFDCGNIMRSYTNLGSIVKQYVGIEGAPRCLQFCGGAWQREMGWKFCKSEQASP